MVGSSKYLRFSRMSQEGNRSILVLEYWVMMIGELWFFFFFFRGQIRTLLM